MWQCELKNLDALVTKLHSFLGFGGRSEEAKMENIC